MVFVWNTGRCFGLRTLGFVVYTTTICKCEIDHSSLSMLQPYNLDEKNFLNKMHEAKKEIEFINAEHTRIEFNRNLSLCRIKTHF